MKQYILSTSQTEIVDVPNVIKLLPLGLVKSEKGNFNVDKESFVEINKHIAKRGLDIVIDYEHQTLDGVQAPAAGWIKELILSDQAIEAVVEWTPKAIEYLKNKEYKYLSPVILVRNKDKKAVVLHSAALTNTPAISGMFAIVNSMNIEGGFEEMDYMKEIRVLLGVDDSTTDEQVLELIKGLQEKSKAEGEVVANKTILGLLKLESTAKTEDAAAAIMALKQPSNYVPVADFESMKRRLDEKDANELVEKALKEGKISAAQKSWATEYALKDKSGFEKFTEKAPKTVPMGSVGDDEDVKKKKDLDDTTLAVCKQIGVSKEDIEKYSEVK